MLQLPLQDKLQQGYLAKYVVKSVKRLDFVPKTVFNLEVEGNNNFFANGVLVHNSSNLILDEASLIDDQIESKVFRMLGDDMDNFYVKVGNPFNRNHFYKSSVDPNYYQMNIDYKVGLAEGRLTEGFVEEARSKPNFSVLYENKFPEADAMDSRSYTKLITDKEFDLALVDIPITARVGIPLMGVDVARGGGCQSVWVVRWYNVAVIVARSETQDLMAVAGKTVELAREYGLEAENVFIDDNGVGGGVTDRLNQMIFRAKGIKTAERPDDDRMYLNKRAEITWKVKQWLAGGGKLQKDDFWVECLQMMYKTNSANGKIQIESKEDMAKRGVPSPDVFDALCLTFADSPYFKIEYQRGEVDFDKWDVV